MKDFIRDFHVVRGNNGHVYYVESDNKHKSRYDFVLTDDGEIGVVLGKFTKSLSTMYQLKLFKEHAITPFTTDSCRRIIATTDLVTSSTYSIFVANSSSYEVGSSGWVNVRHKFSMPSPSLNFLDYLNKKPDLNIVCLLCTTIDNPLSPNTITTAKSYDGYCREVYPDKISSNNDKSLKSLSDIRSVLEDVVKYCENQQIYDKLGSYGDFYYRIKTVLKENNEISSPMNDKTGYLCSIEDEKIFIVADNIDDCLIKLENISNGKNYRLITHSSVIIK